MSIALAFSMLFALRENVACTRDATQTYTLYLPSNYTAGRTWPVLFIFDPRGRGTPAAEIFRPAAEEYGWILLSSNDTRSDTTWETNERAVQAMLPELSRYAVMPNRVYAAGFSGGATIAWIVARGRHFAGVINSGQPWQPELETSKTPFAVFSTSGKFDFNNFDARKIDDEVAQTGRPHRVEIFDGVHQWMPEAVAREAVGWHELIAMKNGSRAADAAFVQKMFDADMQRAAGEKELDALRRYEAIVRDYSGLHDITEASRAVASLEDSKSVRQQLREERDADDYEKREIASLIDRLRQALANATPLGALERQFGLHPIMESAKAADAHGLAAQRALETLFVQSAFYLPQQYFAAHEYEKAAIVLTIATLVHPERADPHYDLARALARTGRKKEALASLQRAIQLAPRYSVTAHTEPDLEALRSELVR